jgi:transcriptional regulator of arginine metabolism
LPEVAGTVAGDDTVLLVCRTLEGRSGEHVAGALAARLLAIAEGLARSGAEHHADGLGAASGIAVNGDRRGG